MTRPSSSGGRVRRWREGWTLIPGFSEPVAVPNSLFVPDGCAPTPGPATVWNLTKVRPAGTTRVTTDGPG